MVKIDTNIKYAYFSIGIMHASLSYPFEYTQ